MKVFSKIKSFFARHKKLNYLEDQIFDLMCQNEELTKLVEGHQETIESINKTLTAQSVSIETILRILDIYNSILARGKGNNDIPSGNNGNDKGNIGMN